MLTFVSLNCYTVVWLLGQNHWTGSLLKCQMRDWIILCAFIAIWMDSTDICAFLVLYTAADTVFKCLFLFYQHSLTEVYMDCHVSHLMRMFSFAQCSTLFSTVRYQLQCKRSTELGAGLGPCGHRPQPHLCVRTGVSSELLFLCRAFCLLGSQTNPVTLTCCGYYRS